MAEQLAELNKGELEVYSTDEKQIGVWIDGKKIYRRVFDIPAISANSSGTIATIAGITPINYSGYAISTANTIPIPYSGRGVASNLLTDAFFIAYNSSNQITGYTGLNRVITGGKLIVDYIKTT